MESKTVNLKNTELLILNYLKDKKTGEYTSPTEIGMAYGKFLDKLENSPHERLHMHSSWASPKCLKLVNKGYLERNKRGWYRIKYYL